jgi:signal transduction histidine kinase
MVVAEAPRSEPTPSPWRRELALDAAVAVAVFAGTLGLLAVRGDADTRSLDVVGVIVAAFASLPLVARRSAPLAVFVVTAAASAALNGLGYAPGPPLGPTVALYFLALSPERTRAPRWVTGGVVAVLFAVHVTTTGIAADEFPTAPVLAGTLVWGGAWVLGDRVRLRRERIAELEERARRAERDAERERRLAAAEERTRIARDLHDSAGHAINVILVHAGAARLLAAQDPERAQAALETIEEVARETLGEIDRLVRTLREEASSEPSSVNVEPPLGLAALESLAERERAAGLAVSIHVQGSRRVLAPAVDQAAYRILQEALTNAARHGDGSASVDICFGAEALELVVSNPVHPSLAPAGRGHGIVGMCERAVLLGGALEAGASDGVFNVRARLPYGRNDA